MPGDELIPSSATASTRAITIDAPPGEVWPWLAQIGQGRGGFYSFDALENLLRCAIHSADRIIPEFQRVSAGDLIRLAPGHAPLLPRHARGTPACAPHASGDQSPRREGPRPLIPPPKRMRGQPSSGMTVAASRSACSSWSDRAVKRISSAPASTTLLTSRTHSAGVPTTAAASMLGTRWP